MTIPRSTPDDRYAHAVIESAEALHGEAIGTRGGGQQDALDALAAWLRERVEGGWTLPETSYDKAVRALAREALTCWLRSRFPDVEAAVNASLIVAIRNAAPSLLDLVDRLTTERDAELAARVDAEMREADLAVRLAKALGSAGHAAAVAVHGDPLAGAVGTIGPEVER